jgi:predicted nucleic acid-binding protein
MRSEGFVVLPVIVELVALLRRDGLDPEPFVERMSERRGLHAVSIGQEELAPISLWMKKYRDIKPDFADASIVHVAEREKIETVLTLDDDFRVYRTSAGKALRVLPREEQ